MAIKVVFEKNIDLKECLNWYENERKTISFKSSLLDVKVKVANLVIDSNWSYELIRTVYMIDKFLNDKKIDSKLFVTDDLENVNFAIVDRIFFNHDSINFANEIRSHRDWINPLIKVGGFEVNFVHYLPFVKSKEILLKTKYGEVNFQTWTEPVNNKLFTLAWKNVDVNDANLRIHYMCETSEIFDSLHCDCRQQLDAFKEVIFENGGLIIYAHEEGRGIGLELKVNAYYETINNNLDTVDAMDKIVGESELRLFDLAAEIVYQFGIKKANVWTNNKRKINPLIERGIEIERKQAYYEFQSEEQKNYLQTKQDRMGHLAKNSACDSK